MVSGERGALDPLLVLVLLVLLRALGLAPALMSWAMTSAEAERTLGGEKEES